MHIKAVGIGSLAAQIMLEERHGTIFGNTSRGLYIKTSGKWTLYISLDTFLGPLTIILDRLSSPLSTRMPELRIGQSVYLSPEKIVFPDEGINIGLSNSLIWSPPDPSGHLHTLHERRNKLESCANKVTDSKPGVGFSLLLPIILEKSKPKTPLNLDNTSKPFNITSVKYAIDSQDLKVLADILVNVLGWGPGLTPSGDDFVVGVLLSLNRWKEILMPNIGLAKLNHSVVEAAYKKTSNLSANLIECASLGYADERLLAAIDWLMTDTSPVNDPLMELIGWGHSSGVAVITGFVAVLA